MKIWAQARDRLNSRTSRISAAMEKLNTARINLRIRPPVSVYLQGGGTGESGNKLGDGAHGGKETGLTEDAEILFPDTGGRGIRRSVLHGDTDGDDENCNSKMSLDFFKARRANSRAATKPKTALQVNHAILSRV